MFIGRGGFPSVGGSSNGNDNGEAKNGQEYVRGYYTRHYYIPLDNTYVIMQIILTLIIMVVGIITYLATYKSAIIDPIENIKNIYMNVYSVLLALLLVVSLIVIFLKINKEMIVKILTTITIISIAVMLIFLTIKLDYDFTYTKNKFEEIYLEQNKSSNEGKKTKIDLGLMGIYVKTEKEYYIDECMELYNIFKVKSYTLLGMHLAFNIFLICETFKILNKEAKKDKINKDDLVLFDEEQNVK